MRPPRLPRVTPPRPEPPPPPLASPGALTPLPAVATDPDGVSGPIVDPFAARGAPGPLGRGSFETSLGLSLRWGGAPRLGVYHEIELGWASATGAPASERAVRVHGRALLGVDGSIGFAGGFGAQHANGQTTSGTAAAPRLVSLGPLG